MSQLGYTGSGNKLQKQKKGPWSLGRKERLGKRAWGKREKVRTRSTERAVGFSDLRVFKGGDFRGGSQWTMLQLSRWILSGLWSPLICWRQGSSVSAAGPDVSHGIACLVLGPELRHNWGLHVFDVIRNLLSWGLMFQGCFPTPLGLTCMTSNKPGEERLGVWTTWSAMC